MSAASLLGVEAQLLDDVAEPCTSDLVHTSSSKRHGEDESLGTRGYDLRFPIQGAPPAPPPEVKSLSVSPRDEIDEDPSQRAHLGEHPAIDRERDVIALRYEGDVLERAVGQQLCG